MRRAHIVTVQLLIPEEEEGLGVEGAKDWVAGLLSEYASDHGLLDWAYVKIGGQFLSPVEVFIQDDYSEGEMFN